MKSKMIETSRLRLLSGNPESLRAAFQDRSRFSNLLRATIPPEWPPQILSDAQEWTAKTVSENPENANWWLWYVILKGDVGRADILIGNTGFKGPPDGCGTLEVGYSILDRFQNHGYATEAVSSLIDWAFSLPGVTRVIAETLPELRPSIRVMEKMGMAFLAQGSEPGVIRYGKHRQ